MVSGANASPAHADVLQQVIVEAREMRVGLASRDHVGKHLPRLESDGQETCAPGTVVGGGGSVVEHGFILVWAWAKSAGLGTGPTASRRNSRVGSNGGRIDFLARAYELLRVTCVHGDQPV